MCVDGLIEGEPGGRETRAEVFSVVQIIMSRGDVLAARPRRGNACQGHNKARAKGLGDADRKDKKIPGSLVMAIIEIRNEFSLSCSVFCLRGCQVTQVARVQEAIGNEELECERELTLAN